MRISWVHLSIAAMIALGAGCENQHVGRMCFIQRDLGAGTSVVVNAQALECPSRLCMHYPKDPGATGVDSLDLCTAGCSSDEDCSDGETSSDSPGTCKGGFACAWPVQVGPLCCKRLCVCKDLIVIPEGGITKPQTCEPTAENQAVCPNI